MSLQVLDIFYTLVIDDGKSNRVFMWHLFGILEALLDWAAPDILVFMGPTSGL